MKSIDIIGTVGPVSYSYQQLQHLIANGLTVFRSNNSHQDDQHFAHYFQIFSELHQSGYEFSVLLDTKGPEIRIESLSKSRILTEGESVFFSEVEPTVGVIPILTKDLAKKLQTGDRFFIDDGKLQLRVLSTDTDRFVAEVLIGGVLSSRKGINIPSRFIQQPILDESDLELFEELANHNETLDYVAISFVRNAEDVVTVRKKLKAFGFQKCSNDGQNRKCASGL